MDEQRREFLDALLETSGPSGFETRAQRVWTEYVSAFADDVRTDAYGNAVATAGDGDPELAVVGHVDEIGFVVTAVDDDGFLRVGPIGGADRTVSKGQHVVVHADDGPVPGVVGQTPIHLRDDDADEYEDIDEQHVDVGAADPDEARDLVDVGDPITIDVSVRDLHGSRVAARALDDRVGAWAAAEALRLVAERDVDATVHAVSTVQEEVGLQGAKMVGFELAPDAAVAVDVTHAADNPSFPEDQHAEVRLGGGPVISRGGSNHPELARVARAAAADADVDAQLQAAGRRTATDADGIFVQRGGVPSLWIGVPNRYMHTPAEVVDLADLDATAALLAAFADRAADTEDGFAVDV